MRKILAVAAVIMILPWPMRVSSTGGRIELPPYEKHTLENGMTVFILENHELPLVSVNLRIPAGSVMDAPERGGTGDLVGRLLMKGAAGMGADEISQRIEELGGFMLVHTIEDVTDIAYDLFSSDLTVGLELLKKIVTEPDFDADELEREKETAKARMKRLYENHASLAYNEFQHYAAGDHPYGRSVQGSEVSVGAITREDILEFHSKYYIPRGSILAVVGDVDGREALKIVEKYFSDWHGEERESPAEAVEPVEVGNYPVNRVYVVDRPEAAVGHVIIGNAAERWAPGDHFSLLLARTILGGAYSSRLYEELRVKRGIVYNAHSELTHNRYGAFIATHTVVKNENTREAIDAIIEELRKLREEQVTDEELRRFKSFLCGRYPFHLETNKNLARSLVSAHYHDWPLEFVERYRELVEEVTAQDIRRIALTYFQADGCIILLVTNYDEVKDELEGLGEIVLVKSD